jgi:diguanylate cyclase (GGDEF)-like protein
MAPSANVSNGLPPSMPASALHHFSIKTRVTAFTLVVFVLSIWAVALYAGHTLRDDMERTVGEQQFSTVSFAADQLNERLTDRMTALESVADVLDSTTLADAAALQRFLELRPILSILFNGGVYFAGVDGTVRASLPVALGRVGMNYLDRDYVAAPLEHGKPLISKPVIGKTLRSPAFAMVAPVRLAHGHVAGVLVGMTDLSKPSFLNKITESRYGRTGGYLLVASQHRLVVTATDTSRIMETLAEGSNPLSDRFILGFEGSGVTVDPDGDEVLKSSKTIPIANWHIVTSLPTAEAFAPVHDMQQRIVLMTLALTLVTATLTWWMLRHELSPLLDAARALSRLPLTGQQAKPLPIARQDEVGALIANFNRMLETLQAHEEQVRQLAFYDALTGLPNRRLLHDRLNQTLAASRRSGCYGALMFLDLDNFKPLNDTHGHGVGDLLLKTVASRLSECVRAMDTVARLGGDEFVVMLSELDADVTLSSERARSVAEKVRSTLAEPYELRVASDDVGATVKHLCSASIGVVMFEGSGADLDSILKQADAAMYQAKNAGRNTIRFFSQPDTV